MSTRPLFHPDLESVTIVGVLHALADPVRLAIVAELRRARNGLNCVETINRIHAATPKSTCSQHFQILREAGLIRCERKGVELSSTLRFDEIESRFPGLIDSILHARDRESANRR